MAKVCSETLKIYKEIFDEAYLLGRSSGSQGIFICPKVAFESFVEEKLICEPEQNPAMQYEMSAYPEQQTRVH